MCIGVVVSKKSAVIRRRNEGWVPPAENGLYVVKTENRIVNLSERSLRNFLRNNTDRVISGKYIYRGEITDVTARLRTDLSGDWDFVEWMQGNKDISNELDKLLPAKLGVKSSADSAQGSKEK